MAVGRCERMRWPSSWACPVNISAAPSGREAAGATGQEAPTLKRVIDLVRVIAAAELAKNPGHDLKDVAAVLAFASTSHLSVTAQRLVGAKATSLARLRTVDLLERFCHQP
jgi:AraC-like DNA-binding protein